MGNPKAELAQLPYLYGDTPTFLGFPKKKPAELTDEDVVILGIPWEGTITWGSWSGCELAPRTIRQASARYSGFLPEYALQIQEHLRAADLGDVLVDMADREKTFAHIEEAVAQAFSPGRLLTLFGGDHSITYPVIRSLSRRLSLGIVHLDAHLDNLDSYDGDPYARNTPFRRIAELPAFNPRNLVHVGIRGPRNRREQWEFAKEAGATVFTMEDIRQRGWLTALEEAIAIAADGVDGLYVSVCSDVLEAALNPGGPPDPGGLTPFELFQGLYRLGQVPSLVAFDYVEIYPPQDPQQISSHIAVWAWHHLLAGRIRGRMARP
ncbi:MAG: agmatinase family protein [Clostridiales bacterium]|nr:agmatinase family protein [Clostridiales bacterium]